MNEEQTQPIVETQPTEQVQQRSDKDKNFDEMRQRIRESEEARERAERLVYELQQKYASAQQQPTEDYEINGEDDSLADFKHLKKVDKKYAKSNEKLSSDINKIKDYIDEQFVRLKHPDIDQLTEKENLRKYAMHDPVMYRTIMSNPNMQDRAELLARNIKVMLNGENAEKNKYYEEEKRMADLKSKPKSVSSVAQPASISPIAKYDPNVRISLTPEQKKEVMRRHDEMKKNMTS